jgi:hypothetical protein
MRHYVECGIGNRWFIRTEFENEFGIEYEAKGVHLPPKIDSLYLRLWVNHTVVILDLKSGLKIYKKKLRSFKFLVGISGS